MSKLYMPFYDIGAGVGPNQKNHPLDMELCNFLFYKIIAKLPAVDLPANLWLTWIGGLHKINWKSGDWIKWLKAAVSKLGYICSSLSENTIDPASQNKSSLIVALNAIYCKQNATEYLNPIFNQTAAVNGSISAGTLHHQMLLSRSMRSPWFRMTATNEGPQRELPFYDLTNSIHYNPSGPSWWHHSFDPLCSYWLKRIIRGNSPAKPQQLSISHSDYYNPSVAIDLTTLPLFAKKFAQLGWPSSTPNWVHPAKGNIHSDSLIVPINFFAYKLTEGTWWQGTASSFGYIYPFNLPYFLQDLTRELLSNWESLYFIR